LFESCFKVQFQEIKEFPMFGQQKHDKLFIGEKNAAKKIYQSKLSSSEKLFNLLLVFFHLTKQVGQADCLP
jgi:hypothetical protein